MARKLLSTLSTGQCPILDDIIADTRLRTPRREQIDISTPHPRPSPTSPLYYNLRYPNQWPDPTFIPSFRPVIEAYIRQMSTLSVTFTSLIAEALLLPPTAFDRYFDRDQQHKLKIIKYPDTAALPPSSTSPPKDETEPAQAQGVGPHKDSMLTTYLLQASSHRGLQAQNMAGTWIDCPPIPGTLIVVIGQGLEALTHGVCASTTHRVLSPSAGSGPRFSMPFFQGVSYDATFESVDIPPAILAMRDERLRQLNAAGGRIDDVEFTFRKGKFNHLGEATLFNRVKSHPDVGERWYPELLAQTRAEQAAAAAATAAATGGEVEAKTEQGGGGAEKDERETVNGIHPTTATQGSAIQAH